MTGASHRTPCAYTIVVCNVQQATPSRTHTQAKAVKKKREEFSMLDFYAKADEHRMGRSILYANYVFIYCFS